MAIRCSVFSPTRIGVGKGYKCKCKSKILQVCVRQWRYEDGRSYSYGSHDAGNCSPPGALWADTNHVITPYSWPELGWNWVLVVYSPQSRNVQFGEGH